MIVEGQDYVNNNIHPVAIDPNGNLYTIARVAQYTGLSTNIKPSASAAGAGSTYLELDTGAQFVSDGIVWVRMQKLVSDPNVVSLLASMDSTLAQILAVLQGTLGH